MTDSQMPNLRREYVGRVWVDHGGVAVVDPMYTDITDTDQQGIIGAEVGAPVDCGEDNFPPGFDHIGVYVTTGLGDGHYPVYADVIAVPGAGTRVARIVIDCLGTEPEAESEDLRQEMIDTVANVREQTRGGIDVKLPYDKSRAVDDEIRRRALGEDENEDG